MLVEKINLVSYFLGSYKLFLSSYDLVRFFLSLGDFGGGIKQYNAVLKNVIVKLLSFKMCFCFQSYIFM